MSPKNAISITNCVKPLNIKGADKLQPADSFDKNEKALLFFTLQKL